MKKLVTTIVLSSCLSIFAFAENIDGTLAVDQPTAMNDYADENTLSAGIRDSNSVKDAEAPSSVAMPTAGYSTFLEGPFVGLEINYVLSSEAAGESSSGLSYGLRFGAQNLEWRTMATIERFGSADYNDYYRGLLQLDYFFLGADNLMMESFALRPYFGLNIGALSIDTQTENVKTITYGAQLGATMNLSTQVDLDIGYRHNLTTSDIVDHTSGLTVGLHYKY